MELDEKSSETPTAAVTAAAQATESVNVGPVESAPTPAPAKESIGEISLDELKAEVSTESKPVIADEIKAVPMDSVDAADESGAEPSVGFPPADNADEAKSAAPEKAERPRREPRPIKPVAPETLEESRSVLAHMLDFLGIEATVRAETRPRSVNLLVSSEEPGRVIGHHGQTLDNLQLIVNRIMQKNDAEFPKLFIDMEGNRERRAERRPDRPERTDRPERPDRPERRERPERGDRPARPERRERFDRGDRPERRERFDRGDRPERRERFDRGDRPERRERFDRGGDIRDGDDRRSFSHDEILRQQALDAAKEVRLFGMSKTLPPMNSHDRRIVHIALEKETGLTTDSIGDGENRSVVIALKEESGK